MTITPITPTEVRRARAGDIPSYVFSAFNMHIKANYRDGRAVVPQDEVVETLVRHGAGRQEIFEKGWLDIEAQYRAAGWNVTYDSSSVEFIFEDSNKPFWAAR